MTDRKGKINSKKYTLQTQKYIAQLSLVFMCVNRVFAIILIYIQAVVITVFEY